MDLSFSFDIVWDVARRVFEESQWVVKKADKAAGRYEVVVSIPSDQHSLPIPFMEKFRVEVTKIDDKSTRVHAMIRFHQWHWGTTRWHVNSFLTDLEKRLEGNG